MWSVYLSVYKCLHLSVCLSMSNSAKSPILPLVRTQCLLFSYVICTGDNPVYVLSLSLSVSVWKCLHLSVCLYDCMSVCPCLTV